MADVEYRVVKKSDLPPPKLRRRERQGQWVAIARTVLLLPPTEGVAVKLDPGDDFYPYILSTLYNACKKVGARVSITRVKDEIWVFRCGRREPIKHKEYRQTCAVCGIEFTAKRKTTVICGLARCKKARHKVHQDAYDQRRARANRKSYAKQCVVCGCDFTSNQWKAVACKSEACQKARRKHYQEISESRRAATRRAKREERKEAE